MWWFAAVALLASIAYVMCRAARYAKGIEEDSVYLVEISRRGAYGEKFLRLLGGRDE